MLYLFFGWEANISCKPCVWEADSVWWCIHILPAVGMAMVPAMGECGCMCPLKDGELVCTTRLLVWSINESVCMCTLNHYAWIKGHSTEPIFQ